MLQRLSTMLRSRIEDMVTLPESLAMCEQKGEERILRLYGHILASSDTIDNVGDDGDLKVGCRAVELIEQILAYNYLDKGIPPSKRIPVRLFIDSPGGDLVEGFSLVSIIEQSKTPIHTVNLSFWCSSAFYVGIAGHKRFSMPRATFLMHEGELCLTDSMHKVQDQARFYAKYVESIIKPHVTDKSRMGEKEYEYFARKELVMLPEDAQRYGFIDEIVTDIDTIL